MKVKLVVLSIVMLGSLTMGRAEVPMQSALTCKTLIDVLVTFADVDVRPYCLEGERKCRVLAMIKERSQSDSLRQALEAKLAQDVQYELSICEIAVRKKDPEYLKKR